MSRQRQKVLTDAEFRDTLSCLYRLKVPQAKDIARCLSVPTSGRKQDILDRIIEYMEQARAFNDHIRLLAVRTVVLKILHNDPVPDFRSLYEALRTGAYNHMDDLNQYSPKARGGAKAAAASVSGTSVKISSKTESVPYRGHALFFKKSPFYELRRVIHGSPQLALPSKSKSVCRLNFILSHEEKTLLNLNKETMKLFALCGVANTLTASTLSAPLQFPIPVEIHVNGNQIKDNVRGIKGKPGTSKPANLTPYLLEPPKTNKFDMAYAGTEESFLLYLYIVESISSEQIMKHILDQPHIHKEATISRIQKEFSHDGAGDDDDDDDIVVSTSSISLKCPLTYARMKFPTRSVYCQHIQCFDGLSYLQLQEQLPHWICPICSSQIDVSHLAISDYYLEILNSTSQDTEAVNINHDGSWSSNSTGFLSEKNDSLNNGKLASSPIDDDLKQDTIQVEDEDNSEANKNQKIEVILLDSSSEDEAIASPVQPQESINERNEPSEEAGIIERVDVSPKENSSARSGDTTDANSLPLLVVTNSPSNDRPGADQQESNNSTGNYNQVGSEDVIDSATNLQPETAGAYRGSQINNAEISENQEPAINNTISSVHGNEQTNGTNLSSDQQTLLATETTTTRIAGPANTESHNNDITTNSGSLAIPHQPINQSSTESTNGMSTDNLRNSSIRDLLGYPSGLKNLLISQERLGFIRKQQQLTHNQYHKMLRHNLQSHLSQITCQVNNGISSSQEPYFIHHHELHEPNNNDHNPGIEISKHQDSNFHSNIKESLGKRTADSSPNKPNGGFIKFQLNPNPGLQYINTTNHDYEPSGLVDETLRQESASPEPAHGQAEHHSHPYPKQLRFSRSAFELLHLTRPNGQSDNEQRTTGLLDISLSDDALKDRSDDSSNRAPAITPIKGRIDNMQLETLSNKKRDISSLERTWNKRLHGTNTANQTNTSEQLPPGIPDGSNNTNA